MNKVRILGVVSLPFDSSGQVYLIVHLSQTLRPDQSGLRVIVGALLGQGKFTKTLPEALSPTARE